MSQPDTVSYCFNHSYRITVISRVLGDTWESTGTSNLVAAHDFHPAPVFSNSVGSIAPDKKLSQLSNPFMLSSENHSYNTRFKNIHIVQILSDSGLRSFSFAINIKILSSV